MKIADNTISRNLVKIFGDKFNQKFKDKFNQIIKEVRNRYPEENFELKPEAMKGWINPDPKNDKIPYRLPTLAHLIKIAIVLEIDWIDLFIEKDRYLDLNSVYPLTAKLLQKIINLDEKQVKGINDIVDLFIEKDRYLDLNSFQPLTAKVLQIIAVLDEKQVKSINDIIVNFRDQSKDKK